jgi:hypothetical protein
MWEPTSIRCGTSASWIGTARTSERGWGAERSCDSQMVSMWSNGTVVDWATESLMEANLAYRLPGTDRLIASGTKLGEDYCRFALPIIELRLAQSAVRVA